MKAILNILCTAACIISLSACKSGSEEGSPFRDSMEAFQTPGIWHEGRQVLTFSKINHQYWCSPSERIIRICDNDGVKHTDLKLDAMPAEGKKVNGSLDGNMGVSVPEIKDLYILKQDKRYVWLWSDESSTGLIIPKYGLY